MDYLGAFQGLAVVKFKITGEPTEYTLELIDSELTFKYPPLLVYYNINGVTEQAHALVTAFQKFQVLSDIEPLREEVNVKP
jgi:hypothetical protein